MDNKSLWASDYLSAYLEFSGVVFKNPTFRLLAGQYPYNVEIKRLSWGKLSHSPVDIIRECTENTILEFRDDDDNLKGLIFIPEADGKNPFKRVYTYKNLSERLQDLWGKQNFVPACPIDQHP